MEEQSAIPKLVDHLFRQESGKMVALYTNFFGMQYLDAAEDIVQETLIAALETWKLKGIPDNPKAWLYKVAKNKLLNYINRDQHFKKVITNNLVKSTNHTTHALTIDSIFLDQEIEDAQLRMIFACCHPSITQELQLILILKTLCGLTIPEIATALLCNEDTIAKRWYRAKEKIKNNSIQLDVPIGNAIVERLDIVLKAIYLIFNEAYKATHQETIIRKDLCFDAIRLLLVLINNPIKNEKYNLNKINALLALCCFHAARFHSRLDPDGNIILLEVQDRTTWDKQLIQQGCIYFKAASTNEHLSEYHVEAAIAYYHTTAPNFSDTNWMAIYYCYCLLYSIIPSPIIAFNKAIAKGYAEGAKAGIEALLTIEDFNNVHFYHTALGDFYTKNKELKKAKKAYQLALDYVVLKQEQKIIQTKLDQLKISG
jgi:RNA polymerase sigma factor (sigma-70 family)